MGFSDGSSLKSSILNFMDIHPVGATMIYGDGQTNMTKIIGTFHDYLKRYTLELSSNILKLPAAGTYSQHMGKNSR